MPARRPLVDVAFLWAARVLSSIATVTVLAVAARSLSVESFAVFAFMVGLIAWLPVMDFGFGSVMQNRLVEQRMGLHDHAGVFAASLITASFLALASGFAILFGSVIWKLLFPEASFFQYTSILELTIGCLLVTGVSMTVHKVYAATNRLLNSAIVSAVQNLLALISLASVTHLSMEQPNLVTMLASYFITYTLVPLFAILYEAHRCQWFSLETRVNWRKQVFFKDAMKFWFVLLLSLVVIQFDQLIAFKFLSSTEFTHYVVASKIISFVYFPFAALLTANWSRVSEAHVEKDRERLLKIVHSSFGIGIAYLFIALVGILIFSTYFQYLLPEGIDRIRTGFLFGVWLVAINKVWTECYALIYLATGYSGIIVSYLPIQASIAVGLQLLFVQFMGAYGLMLGCALSYFATSHWILFFRTKSVFKNY